MSHPRPLHWRWVKEQREQIAGWQCEWLGCAEPWHDGHHRSYENYGDERPDDIRLLCRRHHDTAHYDLGPAPDQLALSLEDYYSPERIEVGRVIGFIRPIPPPGPLEEHLMVCLDAIDYCAEVFNVLLGRRVQVLIVDDDSDEPKSDELAA